MRLSIFCLALLSLSSALYAAPLAPTFSADTTKKFFESKKFTCTEWDEKKGMTCTGKIKEKVYPEEIVIFIPPKYELKKNADVIFHYHGFLRAKEYYKDKTRDETFQDVLEEFAFADFLKDSERNSILILPSSQGSGATYKRKFVDEQGFWKVANSLFQLLKGASLAEEEEPANIAFVGHSGAWIPMSYVLSQKCPKKAICYRDKIKEVYLLDATYGGVDDFVKYIKRDSENRFISVFRTDKPTEGPSFQIWEQLNLDRLTQLNGNQRKDLFKQETLLTKKQMEELHEQQVAFIQSSTDHWDLVTEFFAKVLYRGKAPTNESPAPASAMDRGSVERVKQDARDRRAR